MAPVIKTRVKTTAKGDATFTQLLADVRRLGSRYVAVGILEPDRKYPDSDATLGQVALWQEYGTHNAKGFPMIPARSFLRSPVDVGMDAIMALKAKLYARVVAKTMTVDKGLAAIGADVVRRMQTTIKRRIAPELAPFTLAMRKENGIQGTIPLLATGFLYNSIHFAVRSFGRGDLGKGGKLK